MIRPVLTTLVLASFVACAHSSPINDPLAQPEPVEEPLLRDFGAEPESETSTAAAPAGERGPVAAAEAPDDADAGYDEADEGEPIATESLLVSDEELGGAISDRSITDGDSGSATLTVRGKNKKAARALRGCVVRVGERTLGKAPLSKTQVPAGSQRVAVRCKGKDRLVRTIAFHDAEHEAIILKKADLKKKRRRR